MFRVLALLCFLQLSSGLVAQKTDLEKLYNTQIDSVATILFRDTLFELKENILEGLSAMFNRHVFKDTLFQQYDFEFINTHISNDRKLRIFSGAYAKEKGVFDYYLFYQYRGESYITGSFTQSSGVEFNDPDLVDLRDQEWFGAVYYQLHDFSFSKKLQLYLLFGFSQHKGSEYRKIVEPIYFDGEGIKFGYPVFKMQNQKKELNRYIIQYSWDSSPVLRYDKELNLIIFDHLTPAPSMYENGLMTMVPDGTYEGFELKNNIWQHIPKLQIEKLFHPPNIDRKRDNSRDIFGRGREKK